MTKNAQLARTRTVGTPNGKSGMKGVCSRSLGAKMANALISLLEAFEELSDPRARECVQDLEGLLLAAICWAISRVEG